MRQKLDCPLEIANAIYDVASVVEKAKDRPADDKYFKSYVENSLIKLGMAVELLLKRQCEPVK